MRGALNEEHAVVNELLSQVVDDGVVGDSLLDVGSQLNDHGTSHKRTQNGINDSSQYEGGESTTSIIELEFDEDAKMNVEKLQKMAGVVRTGGKGSVRRKKKAVHKTTTTDDKRLQSTLKRIGVNAIPTIEEVNIFKDETVIQFLNPKVQASIAANTWVVSGAPQTKKLQDILPGILNQLGPDNLDNLRKLAEQFQKQAPGGGEAAAATSAQEDDDDVPELVAGETFEAAAEEGQKS
ncbi:hypothetical protein L2E82_01110 [Cichorium intybus]|uniref:Uncharacterized protein n=1 Tax=Cichorium intybus TaxID=13427 RepID=A0ACB9GXP5_CICIN|nr:hypothetical protein L2E82_01110 [Cichorium intybus]